MHLSLPDVIRLRTEVLDLPLREAHPPTIDDETAMFSQREKTMKAIVVIFGLFLTSVSAKADIVSACDADKYVGKSVTVEGVVSDVHHAKSGKATFINMCGKFPNNAFYGVIFPGDATKFPGIDLLKGKTIEIDGRIQRHNDYPEIILNEPGQLKIK